MSQEDTTRTQADKESAAPSVWSGLGREWEQVASLVLSPVFVFLMIAIFVTYWYVGPTDEITSGNESPVSGNSTTAGARIVLQLVFLVLSGVLGAYVDRKLSGSREREVLVTRGRSAIRGLRLLRSHIMLLRASVADGLETVKGDGQILLGQTMERMGLLQDQALVAIDEWQDIVPEANVSSQLEAIQELRIKDEQLRAQAKSLEQELSETKSHSAEEKKTLSANLEAMQTKLRATEAALREKEAKLASTVSLPSSGSGGLGGILHSPNLLGDFSNLDFVKCPKCGTRNLKFKSPALSHLNKCSSCKEPY